LTAFKQRRTEQPCLIKVAGADIDDKQHRQCFESTEVRESLSFCNRMWRPPPFVASTSRPSE
jgi:hypothetical protein